MGMFLFNINTIYKIFVLPVIKYLYEPLITMPQTNMKNVFINRTEESPFRHQESNTGPPALCAGHSYQLSYVRVQLPTPDQTISLLISIMFPVWPTSMYYEHIILYRSALRVTLMARDTDGLSTAFHIL